MIGAFEDIRDTLDEIGSTGVFQTKMPLIGKSINDLVDFSESLGVFVERLKHHPARTIDEVEEKITDALRFATGGTSSHAGISFSDAVFQIDLTYSDSYDPQHVPFDFSMLDVTDRDSGFAGKFSVDVAPLGGDGMLALCELPSTSFGEVFKPALSADKAKIDLQLVASFGGRAQFPTIGTNFLMCWELSEADPSVPPEQFGDVPTIAFNDVTLNLGEYFSEFLSPIFAQIQKGLCRDGKTRSSILKNACPFLLSLVAG